MKSRPLSILSLLVLVGCQAQAGDPVTLTDPPSRVAVVSLVPEGSDFAAAAEALAARHRTDILTGSPDALDAVEAALQEAQPTQVALVVEPSDLDQNLAVAVMAMLTRLDDDPFVDAGWGFITGRDADAAMRLVAASDAEPSDDPTIASYGVASKQFVKRSMAMDAAWPHAAGSVPVRTMMSSGDADADRDDAFVAQSMRELEDHDILLLASHGYPDGLVGGPKAADLAGRDLSGKVALNIACYTGVTGRWFEPTAGTLAERTVAPEDSFCLAMVDAGVAGYFAYASPRPAGPTMMGQALQIATDGRPLGSHQRDAANAIVMAHLLAGHDGFDAVAAADGDPANGPTPADSVHRWSATGLLIGDPTFIPHTKTPAADPLVTTVEPGDDSDRVAVSLRSPVAHFFAGDQLSYWNGSAPAMRLETTIPIGDRDVADVTLADFSLDPTQTKLVAAVDDTPAGRLLRIKLNFPQPTGMARQTLAINGLNAAFAVRYGEDAGIIRE